MSAPALNLTALIALEKAAERMAAFSFSAIEQQKGYRAALQAFHAPQTSTTDCLG